jgi:outer membrane protein TolC
VLLLAALPNVAAKALSPVASPPPPPPVAAGPELRVSLADAVALGLRDNRTIRSAYLERVAQKFDLVVARRQFLPKLNIVAGVSRDRFGGVSSTTTTLAPTGTWLLPTGATVQFSWARTGASAGLAPGVAESSAVSVSQPLLRGAGLGVNQAPIRIAALQEQINHLGLKTTVSDTVTQIVLAYRALMQAQGVVHLAEDSVQRADALVATNQALIDAGRMAAADILQTKADAATQRLALLQAKQQQASAQLALLRLMGLDLHTNLIAADAADPQPMIVDLDRVIALALDNRTDVLAQRKVVEQDQQSAMVARNNRLWDLSVVAGAARDKFIGPPGLFPENSSSVGLQLSIPIGDFSARQAEVRAETNLRTDRVRLDDLQQAVEAEVRDSEQGLDAAWRQLQAAREARRLAAQTVTFANEKLKAGRASNFEVLSFEASLRTAELQELTSGINYLNALTLLDQQVGGTLDTWRIDLHD